MHHMADFSSFPTFASIVESMAAAERGEGWLSACEKDGRFLVLNREFLEALGDCFRTLDARPILEVCAGCGELAKALSAAGVNIIATDVTAAADSGVLRLSAEEALDRFQPRAVLGAFVPFDARIDEAVMAHPSVQHYVVLGARLGGSLGSKHLWQSSGWSREPLNSISRWMLTRHDVWLGLPDNRVLQHGEAWHFRSAG